eukprot:comp75815_c0_seq1/m.48248 comp75815_c0_seq1/g.48248  ORF comp75815_c0_seq1/g.48248 comp75815_c0_seq1/m.48248 type:complete len:104 (-) comp75815_c0_seq1:1093-1404(-)
MFSISFSSSTSKSRFMQQQHFCAYDNCKAVFDFEPGRVGSADEYKVECFECKRMSCVQCKVPWQGPDVCRLYGPAAGDQTQAGRCGAAEAGKEPAVEGMRKMR